MRQTVIKALPSVLALLIALTGPFCASPEDAPVEKSMGILVPAYFYPAWWDADVNLWDNLVLAAGRVDIIAIMNPTSGPGASQNPDYVTAVTQMHGAGGRVIGYVPTTYGNRAIADSKADIDAYYAWYDADGIFFDEMSTDTGKIAYYRELHDYLEGKDPGAFITGNAGVNTDAGYLETADLLVIFEQSTGYDAWSPSSWTGGHSAARFCNLVYGVSGKAAMEEYVDLAHARNIGYVFITDDVLPNPWDTLPAYWEDEVTRVAGTR